MATAEAGDVTETVLPPIPLVPVMTLPALSETACDRSIWFRSLPLESCPTLVIDIMVAAILVSMVELPTRWATPEPTANNGLSPVSTMAPIVKLPLPL